MTPLLAFTAAIAMALVVFRAATQAITIDEATTYVLFVQNDIPFQWLGSTNNHVLNTALMRLTTRLFGVSELSARLPALLGAAIYIVACYRFCRRLAGGWLLQWAALVCLTFSPFVMDYLVAARGYSLALGFLMTALVADPRKLSGCVLVSVAIGLGLASNFSFAFVLAAVLVVLFVTSWRETNIPRAKLVAAYTLPALVITIVISAPALLNFPRAELTAGSHGLLDSFVSVLKPQAANFSPWLLAVPAIVSVGFVRPNIFVGGFALTIALHIAGFHLLGLLYPLDRTGVFLVPLVVGAIAASTPQPRARTAALLFVAALSLASLKLDHFEEWDFDADSDKIYSVATCLHQRHHLNSFASGWPFIGTTNFYRETKPKATFPVVADESTAPPETDAFILDTRLTPTIVKDRNLVPIWRSTRTQAIIAVPSSQAERFQGSVCLE